MKTSTSVCRLIQVLARDLFLACRWPLSCYMLLCPFFDYSEGETALFFSSYKATNPIIRASPSQLNLILDTSKVPISKYQQIGDLGFNIRIFWETQMEIQTFRRGLKEREKQIRYVLDWLAGDLFPVQLSEFKGQLTEHFYNW